MITKRKKIISFSLIGFIFLAILGFWNYSNPYDSLSQQIIFVSIGIIFGLHFLTVLFLTFFYFIKKNKYLGNTYLICFGIDFLLIIIFFILVFVAATSAMKGAITG